MKFIVFLLAGLCALAAHAQPVVLVSPDSRLQILIETDGQLSWSINYDGQRLMGPGRIGMVLDNGVVLGQKPRLRRANRSTRNETLSPVVPVKTNSISNHYNALELSFAGRYSVEFRAYNDGAAYRFVTALKGNIVVQDEISEFTFPKETSSFFPAEDDFMSHYERDYLHSALDTLDAGKFCSLPVLMEPLGKKVLVTEADLYDYPGMFLKKVAEGNTLKAVFPPVVLETAPLKGSEDRSEVIVRSDSAIARTTGTRTFPWRLCVVGSEKELLETNLVYQLSRPLAIENTDWIKPGLVAWDWYNALNIYGVDFASGLNTETYKYYIDFAAAFGLPYIILDEGWSASTTDILHPAAEIDLQELVSYGRKKNVDLILWVLWKPLDENMEKAMSLFAEWGVKGIKIDFMQRTDQYMVNYYERIVREAARHQLLIDFHGAYKPSGLRRAYPNLISYEGVKGNENNKWSQSITPEHNVTLPFTRMVAGPMDFTPGAMSNAHLADHPISFMRPVSLGTRCHQMAMYVVFESPLQMLCDAPSAYYRDEDLTAFIASIPTVWDETRALDSKVGDYVTIARRSGDKWFVGAMTDWTQRDLVVNLDFLPEGDFQLTVLKDGVNAGKFAEDYRIETMTVNRRSAVNIQLASGGGWVARMEKK